ncbi:glutamine-binding periplasmic protein precursor [mine drainage metagenome]|uniref:Glutamine-binding periplasmic protein n=1 Tax=mine drainage metagenome TaxID=410659 RepID=A0A1J5Q3U6_9ZZZZ
MIKVPAKYQKKGSLIVATDASYAPMEFIDKDGKTVVGMDVDIGHAIGKILGLKLKFENASFDSIIPALQSGKYDVGMSSFSDTKKREEVVDFVTYFSAGTSFYVKAHSDLKVNGLDDLCGKSVAIEKGTTQVDDANAQSKKCTDAGKQAVTLLVFPDQNGANLAIASGRAQAGLADSPVAAWIVKESRNQFKLTGAAYNTVSYGVAVPKGSDLAAPLHEAINQLIKSGEYANILRKWGITQGGLKESKVNDAAE